MDEKLYDFEVLEELVDKKKLKEFNETPKYENYHHRKKRFSQSKVVVKEDIDEETEDV